MTCYGLDIGGWKSTLAKVDGGTVNVLPNTSTGQRYTPTTMASQNRLAKGVRQFGESSANGVKGQGETSRDRVKAMGAYMTHLHDKVIGSEPTEADKTKCYVLTVPHYCKDAEVSELLDSFEISGASDDGLVVGVIKDLTSAALEYGYYKMAVGTTTEENRKVVFLDFGHSAIQAALVELTSDGLQVLAYESDRLTGGKFVNNVLSKKLCDDFAKGRNDKNIALSEKSHRKVVSAADRAKKMTSTTQSNVPINIECLDGERDLYSSISRSEVETLCQESFDRVTECLKKISAKCDGFPEPLHSIEVIGGSSRMPKFREAVSEVFPHVPVKTSLNADEAVAKGAALHCALITGVHRARPYKVEDTSAKASSVRIRHSTDKTLNLCSGSDKIVLDSRPEGDTLVLEYNNDNTVSVDEKSLIAVYQLDLPENLVDGFKIELGFAISKKGLIGLNRCTLVQCGKDNVDGMEDIKLTESRVGEMAKHELDQCKSEEDQLREADSKELRRLEAKNRLEESVYQLRSLLDEVPTGNRSDGRWLKASIFCQTLQDVIDNNENYQDWPVAEYERQFQEVDKHVSEYLDWVKLEEAKESERQKVKKQLEDAVSQFKKVLSRGRSNPEVLHHVKEVDSVIDNCDDYPSWPASKYQGILDRLKELAQEYEEWLVEDQRSQRQNKLWHQGGHPRDFSGRFSNQRRHNNETPRFRSAFDQDDFGGDFFGRRQRIQPNFYDLFW